MKMTKLGVGHFTSVSGHLAMSLILVSVLHSVLHCGHVNIGLQTEVVRWIIIIIIGHGGNLYGLIKIVAGSMEQLCYLDMILNEF